MYRADRLMDQRDPTTEVFLRAYDELADALFRHCLYRVYDRERARELMQEAFMRTWEQLADGKEIRNLKAFLYRVTNNLIIDHARKRKEQSLEAVMETGFEPSDGAHGQIIAGAEISLVMEVMRDIEDDTRKLIVMRYVDGLGPKDIAAILDESENVISVRLHRGLKRVRMALERKTTIRTERT